MTTSTERLVRYSTPDLELRSDGRTVTGIAVPYDTPTYIASMGAEEQFVRGAFARTIAERGDRIKLLAQHDARQMPLGRLTSLREDAAGLYIEGRISATQAGDEALQLLADGALDSFSVGFSPIRSEMTRDGVVTRQEVKLHEVSLVSFPAYEAARVLAVRSDDYDPNLDPLIALAALRLGQPTRK